MSRRYSDQERRRRRSASPPMPRRSTREKAVDRLRQEWSLLEGPEAQPMMLREAQNAVEEAREIAIDKGFVGRHSLEKVAQDNKDDLTNVREGGAGRRHPRRMQVPRAVQESFEEGQDYVQEGGGRHRYRPGVNATALPAVERAAIGDIAREFFAELQPPTSP